MTAQSGLHRWPDCVHYTRPYQFPVPVPLPVPVVEEPVPDAPPIPLVPEVPLPEEPMPELPEVPPAPDAPVPPDVPAAPEPVDESPAPDAPDVPLVVPGQKQEAASVPDAPEVVPPDAPEVVAPDAPEVVSDAPPVAEPDVAPLTSLAPLVVDEPLVPEVPLDSEPPTGVSGIRVPCEPSAQVQLVLELPEVPVAPLAPEVPDGSVEEPDVVAPLPESEGDAPLIPEPLVAAGSLLPEVAPLPVAPLLPEVMPLSDAPLVVPYVPEPDVDGVADVAGSVADAPLVPPAAKATLPAPSMDTKIAMGNFFI
jgi:hypothetical protein